jgi:hypothetical protein
LPGSPSSRAEATDPEAISQFVIDSTSLSLVGGLIGAVLGCGITTTAAQAFPDGLASRAASLDPGHSAAR